MSVFFVFFGDDVLDLTIENWERNGLCFD